MKALIFQTMLALLIPGLSDTPKTLLTPPSAYDFSLVSTPSTEYLTHEWTYGTPSFRYPLDLNKTGGNTWSYTGFTWNNTIYSLENSYAVASVQLNVKTPDIYALSENVAAWGSNYLSGSSPRLQLVIDNYSKYPFRLYLDISSNGGATEYTGYLDSVSSYNFYTGTSYISNNNLTGLYIPPFQKIILNLSTINKLDALYIDVVSPTSTFQGYEDYIFNSGYNDGYTTAYDEFGNFDWLSSLFTTMGDLLAIEILPGITIGLILLIPIVFGVLRFIMGLFR